MDREYIGLTFDLTFLPPNVMLGVCCAAECGARVVAGAVAATKSGFVGRMQFGPGVGSTDEGVRILSHLQAQTLTATQTQTRPGGFYFAFSASTCLITSSNDA